MTPDELVREHTIYSCVMGSRAFGLATEGSDTDVRGVYLAPTPLFWRFDKPPAHVEGPREEQFSWELERFCELALRNNPNVLECLHSPVVEYADDLGRELVSLRGAFLSRQAHRTFVRYADGQRRKLDADVRRYGHPRWKHAMHLLRLLTSCRDLLRTASCASTSARTATASSRSGAARCPGRRSSPGWTASRRRPTGPTTPPRCPPPRTTRAWRTSWPAPAARRPCGSCSRERWPGAAAHTSQRARLTCPRGRRRR